MLTEQQVVLECADILRRHVMEVLVSLRCLSINLRILHLHSCSRLGTKNLAIEEGVNPCENDLRGTRDALPGGADTDLRT